MPVLPGDALPAWTLLSPRRHIQDPASQRLTWNKSPKSVLVVKKIRDASLLQPFKELCVYLMEASEPAWGVATQSPLGAPTASAPARLCSGAPWAPCSSGPGGGGGMELAD